MLIVGAIIRMVGNRRNEDRFVTETFNRIGKLLVTMGFLGFILFFFSYQNIVLLSARFWFLAWGLGLIVWAVFILQYVVKVVPKERAAMSEKAEMDKYLPKKK